jgi:photosystem II stability/assembly factor-like uncharacterized protein
MEDRRSSGIDGGYSFRRFIAVHLPSTCTPFTDAIRKPDSTELPMNGQRFIPSIATIILLAGSSLHAQQCLAPLALHDSGAVTFTDMQRAFFEWSRGRNLEQVKGWKWYKRWEAFNEQRAEPDGSLPDAATCWRGAMQAIDSKRGMPKGTAAAASGWSPVGPMRIGNVTDPENPPGMGRINCVAFHPTDPNTLWVGVAQGGVWKSINAGETWMPLTDELPILRISDIAVDTRNPDLIYIAVGDYEYLGTDLVHENRKRNTHYGMGVFKTTDGGVTWNPTGLSFKLTDYDGSLIRRVFIHPDDPDYLLAAGTSGTWRSSDGGATWTHGRSDLIWDIERDPSDPSILYASTGHVASFAIGSASLLKSTDFGASWSRLSAPIPEQEVQRVEIGISPSDPNYVYAVACSDDETFHSFYRSTDRGATWSVRSNRNTGPNILGGEDGGQYDTRGQGTYDLAIIVDPENRDRVYVGGINVWGSSDGGSTWDGVSHWIGNHGPSIHADQHFFAYNPLDRLYYVCNDGGIYATPEMAIGNWASALADPGYRWPTVWQNISSGMAITSFYRIGLSRGNAGYVVGGAQDNSSYYSNGSEWWHLFGGDGMECLIDPDDPRIVYGSSQYGFIHATADGGMSTRWSLTWPIMRDYGEQGEWTSPMAIDPKSPHQLYIGLGNLWRSDGADTVWRAVSTFPPQPDAGIPTPISAMSISEANPDYIYIAKRIWHIFNQPSEAWMTSDGGTNWQNITAGLPDSLYLTYIATHGSDPGTAWVTAGGFTEGVKVFRTTDAGGTWINISRDLPNLPVNCIVHDDSGSSNTLYVGTDIGVYYTNDRMDGWLPFSEGLPNVIVSELEIHQGSRKLYAATFGRGIWMSDLMNEGNNSVESRSTLAAMSARIAPSPVRGAFSLELSGCGALRSATLEIVDITGRRVDRREITIDGDSHIERFDLDLPFGIYFLRVSHGVTSRVVRFVVERLSAAQAPFPGVLPGHRFGSESPTPAAPACHQLI